MKLRSGTKSPSEGKLPLPLLNGTGKPFFHLDQIIEKWAAVFEPGSGTKLKARKPVITALTSQETR